MTQRLTSWLVLSLAILFGALRKAGDAMVLLGHHEAFALEAITDGECSSTYVVTSRLQGHPGVWTVYNCTSDRAVATQLTRKQADTLCTVLTLACLRPINRRKEAIRRKGS
jgi:hypothetical protein